MQPSSKSSVASVGIAALPSRALGQPHTTGVQNVSDQVVDSKSELTKLTSSIDSKKDSPDAVIVKPLAAYQIRMGESSALTSSGVKPDLKGSHEARRLALVQAKACLTEFLKAAGPQLPQDARCRLRDYLGRAEYRAAYEVIVGLWNSGCRWSGAELALVEGIGQVLGVQFPTSTCPRR